MDADVLGVPPSVMLSPPWVPHVGDVGATCDCGEVRASSTHFVIFFFFFLSFDIKPCLCSVFQRLTLQFGK